MSLKSKSQGVELELKLKPMEQLMKEIAPAIGTLNGLDKGSLDELVRFSVRLGMDLIPVSLNQSVRVKNFLKHSENYVTTSEIHFYTEEFIIAGPGDFYMAWKTAKGMIQNDFSPMEKMVSEFFLKIFRHTLQWGQGIFMDMIQDYNLTPSKERLIHHAGSKILKPIMIETPIPDYSDFSENYKLSKELHESTDYFNGMFLTKDSPEIMQSVIEFATGMTADELSIWTLDRESRKRNLNHTKVNYKYLTFFGIGGPQGYGIYGDHRYDRYGRIYRAHSHSDNKLYA